MAADVGAKGSGGGGVAFGDFGRDLETARRSEFFGFFNLVGSSYSPEEPSVIVFRPSSAEMARLVGVRFDMPGERSAAVELHVLRSFIQDPEQYPFAADITSSFLRAALRDAPGPEAHAAADDIARFQPRGAAARVLARSEELLPSPHLGSSPQVRVYAGVDGQSRERIGGYTLELDNPLRQAGRTLEVRIAAAPPPARPSLWARVRGTGRETAQERRLAALLRSLGGDADLRMRFVHHPEQVLRDAGLDPALLGPVAHASAHLLPAFLRPKADEQNKPPEELW